MNMYSEVNYAGTLVARFKMLHRNAFGENNRENLCQDVWCFD